MGEGAPNRAAGTAEPGTEATATTPSTGRTATIADAAVRVVARDGLRALTHRAVDRTAGLPQGSTSYYASTRRALLELVVRRLAERTARDTTGAIAGLDRITPERSVPARAAQLAAAVAGLVDALAAREDDMRARYALLLDLSPADPLHAALSTRSSVRGEARCAVTALLGRFGVAAPERRATELVQLADALTFARVAAVDPEPGASTRGVLEAYVHGIGARP